MTKVQVGGARVAHTVQGRGTPLLLVAGTGYPGATWLLPELVDELARHHTVVTFDHRGTGGTPGDEQPYTTRRFAADALALLRALGRGPAHVVGHSMGGRVAQWMALDEPAAMRSLVLAATGAGGRGNPGQPAGLPVDAMAAMVEHGYRGYMERHIASTFFTPEYAASCPQRVRWLIDAFWDNRPSVRDYLRHMAARQDHDTSGLLGEIRVPALVLIGEADVRRGPTGSHFDQSKYLHEHLPSARMQVLPDLSHGMFWQAPQTIAAALIQWTTELEGATWPAQEEPPLTAEPTAAGGSAQ